MKKQTLLFLLLTVSAVFAQVKAQDNDKVKKILDAVTAKLKASKGINAGFVLVSRNRAGKINNNATGRISIKGNKYYIKQGGTEIFSDGNKTWNYNGNDEVTVTPADADDNALSPPKITYRFYDKDFSYKLVSSAGAYNEIQLLPVDKRKNFQRIDVFVDKSKMMITRAKVLDKSSNTIEFTLKNINTASNIPDETFVFNQKKYKKNIEVIE